MEIFIILLLVLLNGLFSLSEIAVVSARKVRLQQWADEGNHRADAALALAREPSHFLSTIQVGITLVGILSGAYGEAALAGPLAEKMQAMPVLAPYATTLASALVISLVAALYLVLGELVPKRLGLLNPERLALVVAGPMRVLSLAAYPLVRLLSAATELILKALGARASKEPPITEEEIQVLMEQGTEAGVFEEAEEELVRNVFRLDQRGIGGLMTPKPDIVFLDVQATPAENMQRITDAAHAIYPVCDGGLDNILGVAQTKALLAQCAASGRFEPGKALVPPLYVAESLSPMELLDAFRRGELHAALVLDDYGEIQGIVTLYDVLEAVVGGMPLAEGEEPMAVRREDDSWLVDGMMPVGEFQALFEMPELPEEEAESYNTVGGFVMLRMGRIPKVADRFQWGGLRFEVMDMDRTRVDKVLVTPLPPREAPEAGTSDID